MNLLQNEVKLIFLQKKSIIYIFVRSDTTKGDAGIHVNVNKCKKKKTMK